MQQQMKVVHVPSSSSVGGASSSSDVNAFTKAKKKPRKRRNQSSYSPANLGPRGKECENCGREHDLRKRENCPAFRRFCNKCGRRNHFANKYPQLRFSARPLSRNVHVLEDEYPEEVFNVHEVSAVSLDDS